MQTVSADDDAGGVGSGPGGGTGGEIGVGLEARLEAVLIRSRQLGFLGPGPVADQIGHAEGFGLALDEVSGTRPAGSGSETPAVVDLGCGGGVPSLPLLVRSPRLRMVLVDAAQRRTAFCLWAAVELGLDERVEVWTGRAEDFANDPARRGRFDAVVARGFGPPASTLECAAPLVRIGGRCVISEPPGGRQWPAEGLGMLGLGRVEGPGGVAVFESFEAAGHLYPRPPKTRQRRPLFEI